MDELVYSLLIRTAQGLTLLGTLRFRVLYLQPAHRADAAAAGVPTPTQQPSTVDLDVYPLEGSISIPLLTGLQPVPLAGVAWFPLIGPFVTGVLGETAQRFGPSMQIFELDPGHICGGLLWRANEPGALTFSVLGTQVRQSA